MAWLGLEPTLIGSQVAHSLQYSWLLWGPVATTITTTDGQQVHMLSKKVWVRLLWQLFGKFYNFLEAKLHRPCSNMRKCP